MFSALYLLEMMVWPWPLTQRLLIPVLPLVAIAATLCLPKGLVPYRYAVAAVFGATLCLNAWIMFHNGEVHRRVGQEMAGFFRWVRTHTGQEETIVSASPALVYFNTGRQGEGLHSFVAFDGHNRERQTSRLCGIGEFAGKRNHQYVAILPSEKGFLADYDERTVQECLKRDRNLIPVFDDGVTRLYRVTAATQNARTRH